MRDRKVIPFRNIELFPSTPPPAHPLPDLTEALGSRVVGQPHGIGAIVPCVEMFQAGLSPENRPAGVFLLLGPTGTGKTRTVEALAEALHGSAKNILKIDCGEFQLEHEVAKLIGAPPGYLGHRETQPLLSQQKLTSVASQRSALSIVLFDEIEKAAPSMARLLLGVLDRGVLRLGDNGSVNFEKTIIFMTSNLGAREMMREMTPAFGFQSAGAAPGADELKQKLQTIGMAAVRRRFSPEFVNRIDHVVTYEPLSAGSLAAITDHEIDRLQRHIDARLAERAFTLEVPWETRQWLMEKGTSTEYGARELKRTIHRHVTQHLASMVSRRQITPGCRVRLEVAPEADRILFAVRSGGRAPLPTHPVVLLVDDNPELLRFMAHEAALAGWEPVQAKTLSEAKRLQVKHRPHAMVIDLEMGGGLGFDFALLTREGTPGLHIAVTCSGEIEKRLRSDCEALDLDVVAKPFRMSSVLNRLQERLRASRGRI